MNRYLIDSVKLITAMLPPWKRKPVRIAWLNALMKKMRNIHDDFIATGAALKVTTRINGQTINIEDYLYGRFGGVILIVHNVLNFEGMAIGAGGDADSYIGETEDESSGIGVLATGANFIVQVPIGLVYDEAELRAIINKFKLPGSTYIIQEV